jgi:NADPH-dependent 2,4-dienoyl-CoA reductase/sulfur reductase-like enzyme
VIGPTRRRFVTLGAVGIVGLGARRLWASPAAPFRPVRVLTDAPRGTRLVIVGASFAGISLARAVKQLDPRVEIVLLEREPFFVFAPAQLRYAFGLSPFHDVARGYHALADQGLPIIRSVVTAIDRDRRRVVTAEGAVEYDYLALTSGVRLAHEEVPGLAEQPQANLCPYDSAALVDLHRVIAAFRGGHVLIATPNGPYKCQPAPYEYALLWAAHIRRRRLKATVTLCDPRSRPTPAAVADGLTRAMDAYASVLRYEPFTQVRSVDPVARTAETEAGRLSYDVLSVIPPNKTMSFISDAGLGAPFIEVDPKTFRSTRDERIYALGDNADTPFAKTAYTAMDAARVAAASIASDLGLRTPGVGLPANLCYPLVAPDRALLIETHWALEQDATGNIQVRVSGRHDDRAKASYARLRRQWEARTLSTLFGP